MRIIRLLSGILITLAITFLGYCYLTKQGIFFIEEKTSEVKIGGEFSLINQDGQIIRSRDFIDKYIMLYFGFSSCSKICPMNLGIISEVLSKLESNINNQLQTFFITVDPERDTIAKLTEFQQQFDHRIQMLTGTRDEIDTIITNYKVFVSNPIEIQQEINHSSIIYLMGPKGQYITHFTIDSSSDDVLSDRIVDEIKKYIH
ncbi:SCO family protein [Wolbachia endosymbiont of Howardula sp.]|nr:SCO family protein [Wolbachia endosymbiont of Howardula sp.]UWI83084.1 SCO family protein [Wolbachia endosymbiont of Howardula sp.]